ncbi:hypothetical protein HK104_003231 [Borealophlyctis nickersoniae]|nr:hypothetical protein HK104_003231 [Borealophlyctis nickersoniae]
MTNSMLPRISPFVATTAIAIAIYYSVVPSSTDLISGLSQTKRLEEYPPDLLPGSAFVDLPFGETHYYLFGPEDGVKVVYVHGISIPSPAASTYLHHLTEAGCRVLTYELYGRGYSSTPAGPHTDALYVAQLALLTQKLGFDRFHLTALSLGGGIATSFASIFPERVEKLVLMAPAGLMPPSGKDYLKYIPFIPDFIMHTVGARLLGRSYSGQLTKPNASKDMIRAAPIVLTQFRHHPGFLRAFLSTIRHFPITRLHDRYAKMGRALGDRVMVIWGTKDTVVPFEVADPALRDKVGVHAFRKLVPQGKVVELEGQGHDFLLAEADLTANTVIHFLKQ